MNSADIHSHMDIESSFSSSSGSNCSAMVMQFQMGVSKPVCKEVGNQGDGLNYFNNGCGNALVMDDCQNNLTMTQTSSLMTN